MSEESGGPPQLESIFTLGISVIGRDTVICISDNGQPYGSVGSVDCSSLAPPPPLLSTYIHKTRDLTRHIVL